LATTDALFAGNVEWKMSNPFAHFLAARSFLDRLTNPVRGQEIRVSGGGSPRQRSNSDALKTAVARRGWAGNAAAGNDQFSP